MPVPRISPEDLKTKLDAADAGTRLLILDVRLKYPYEHSTLKLPGAQRLDPIDPSQLPREREIVAYDSDPDELVSSRVAGDLIKAGFRASALKGGIVDWITAKLPTEVKEGVKQAPPEPGSLKG